MKPLSSRPAPLHLQRAELQSQSKRRLFAVDGGYVVVCANPAGLAEAERLSKAKPGRRITLVLPVPDGDVTTLQSSAARAANACTRLLIYERESLRWNKVATRALLMARLVRGAARVECGVVPDGTRALRHCVDNIAPDDIIVYSCEVPDNVFDILGEYGAKSVAQIVDRDLADARSAHVPHAPARVATVRQSARMVGGF